MTGMDRRCVFDDEAGYVQYIESWGSDERIIESARMSTRKGFLGWGADGMPGDERLLRYLWEHKHMSPFEMCGMTLEVQAPIFVFREWHRHRTQSYNEMSARYVEVPDLCYVPSAARLRESKQATGNKQGSGPGLSEQDAIEHQVTLSGAYHECRLAYRKLLWAGVAKEVARMCLPVSQYSTMRASANLRNWLQFLTLRLDKAAQWEIRQYAAAVLGIVEELFPRTAELFTRGRAGG